MAEVAWERLVELVLRSKDAPRSESSPNPRALAEVAWKHFFRSVPPHTDGLGPWCFQDLGFRGSVLEVRVHANLSALRAT